jgi:hypothetical protein
VPAVDLSPKLSYLIACSFRVATRSFIGFGAGLAAALVAATVHAQAIVYTAPAECPPQAEFVSALRARTAELKRAELDATHSVILKIVPTKTGYSGVLEIAADDRLVVSRQLEDLQCIALVEGFALVTAMALNPSVPMPLTPVLAFRAVTATHQFKTSPEPGSAGKASNTSVFDVVVAAVAGLATAPTPETLLSGGAHLAVHHRRRASSFGVSVHYGQTEWRHYLGGDARFRWATSRIVACPLGWRHRILTLSACGMAEIGLVRGESRRTRLAASSNAWWVAPGVGGLASFGHRGVVLELFAGAVRPLGRDQFYFAGTGAGGGNETVNRPPAVGLAVELRMGARF